MGNRNVSSFSVAAMIVGSKGRERPVRVPCGAFYQPRLTCTSSCSEEKKELPTNRG